MSLAALRALRGAAPKATISILAKPWVADLYRRESFCDELIPYTAKTLGDKYAAGRALRERKFDAAILLQNAFEAAAVAFAARIPERIGYSRDGRGMLLTQAIPVPRPGEIPRHERFYYLELLRRAGIIDKMPQDDVIRLEGVKSASSAVLIGVSPGAAYGSAKRWLPERFAEAANRVAKELGATVMIFGSEAERALCASVASAIVGPVRNLAGETSLAEFIDLAA